MDRLSSHRATKDVVEKHGFNYNEIQAKINKDHAPKPKEEPKPSSGSGSSSSSSSKKKTESTTKVAPRSYNEFCDRTGITSILTSGEFNSSDYIKQKYKNYQEYLEKMYERYS